MPSLMADHDVEGQFNLLLRLLMSDDWRDFWLHLGYDIDSFERLEIATDIADVDLWRLCQERDIILITGNWPLSRGPAGWGLWQDAVLFMSWR